MSVSVLLARGEADTPLQRELLSIAQRWGRETAGNQIELVHDPFDASGSHPHPQLLIWPVLPRWRPEHASAALDDLGGGCDLVLGPTVDGDFYLLGLARPLPGVLERFRGELGDDAVGLAARTAAEEGIEIGLLRAERPLRSAADSRAALVDPLTPPEVVALLRD